MIKTIAVCAMCVSAFLVSALPVPKNVPELMTTFNRKKIQSCEQWEKVRAPELFNLFANEEYGYWPENDSFSVSFKSQEPDKLMMNGKAIRKRIRIIYKGESGTNSFVATAFIPVSSKS